MSIEIRLIAPKDNSALATIIRSTIDEFGVPRIGTAYEDPHTDRLYDLFQAPGSSYFVAEEDGEILGGCGISPTAGLPEGCAELVRFFMTPSSRGKGIGKELMGRSIIAAKEMGYKQIYLESLPQLNQAVRMYERAGFKHLTGAMGESGHYSCTIWMLLDLD